MYCLHDGQRDAIKILCVTNAYNLSAKARKHAVKKNIISILNKIHLHGKKELTALHLLNASFVCPMTFPLNG